MKHIQLYVYKKQEVEIKLSLTINTTQSISLLMKTKKGDYQFIIKKNLN
jgi:hypothetical protein